jgi:hypothetical protein
MFIGILPWGIISIGDELSFGRSLRIKIGNPIGYVIVYDTTTGESTVRRSGVDTYTVQYTT